MDYNPWMTPWVLRMSVGRILEHTTHPSYFLVAWNTIPIKTAAVGPSVLQLAGTVSNVRLEHGQARSLFVQPTVRFDLR